ncbi:MAG: tyrosine-type recombinase/integrase [Xanthobacteraceae bacterium]
MGKTPDDGLVLARWDGTPRSPNNTTKDWTRTLADLKLPVVSLHALRHTHASQLIASGMDVLTISRRLGHSSPTITFTATSSPTPTIGRCSGRSSLRKGANGMRTKLAYCGGNPVANSTFASWSLLLSG